MTEIVATLSHLARSSPHINQRSGVSVRFTITNHEVMVANATRRALRHGEKDVAPRISDLEALPGVDDGQDRDRVARGGPRRADRREPREGGGAHGVQGAVHARALPPDRHRVRRGRRDPRRRGRHLRRVRRRCSSSSPRSARPSPTSPAATSPPRRSRPPSSSSSRACTSASASTRTPSAPAPPTAPGPRAQTALCRAHAPLCGADATQIVVSRGRPLGDLGGGLGVAVAVEEAEAHVEALAPLVVVDAGPPEDARAGRPRR